MSIYGSNLCNEPFNNHMPPSKKKNGELNVENQSPFIKAWLEGSFRENN
jgi:hypothetical protein